MFLNLFLRCCERCLDENPSILKFILKFSFNAHKKINIQTNNQPNSGKGYGYATKTNFSIKIHLHIQMDIHFNVKSWGILHWCIY